MAKTNPLRTDAKGLGKGHGFCGGRHGPGQQVITVAPKPKPAPPQTSWWATGSRETFNRLAEQAAERMKLVPVESSQARREFDL